MLEKMTPEDVTPAVKAAVVKVLARMTIAQVTRAEVDKVQRAILENYPLYTEPFPERCGAEESERIFEPGRTWRAATEYLLPYWDMVDTELRKLGIKPAEMEKDFCPALVAEHEQRKAEWELMDASAEMLKMDFDGAELNSRLLCEKNGKGLEQRQEWIDLMIKLVVNLPD